MEYATRGQAASALAQFQGGGAVAGSLSPVDKPRLSHLLDQLEKTLAECHHCTSSIEGAVDRLGGLGLDPKSGQTTTAPQPPALTFEQRLAEAIANATYIAHRLGNASQRLTSVV